jgi:DUF2934 family protein
MLIFLLSVAMSILSFLILGGEIGWEQSIRRRDEVMRSQSEATYSMSTAEAPAQEAPMEKQGSRNAPTPEEIRKRAFEIHLLRGGIHGCDPEDWMQAKRELRETHTNNEKEAKEK